MATDAFSKRGVVEGFYGPPWSHSARIEMIEFLAEHGMNAYAYAPKGDDKHRAKWREPYTREEVARFTDLAARATTGDVRFGFAVSPGLDITYESDADRALLLTKMRALADAGVSWFLLLLDDIPLQPGLGPRHAALATALLDSLRSTAGAVAMTLCPTEYVGTRPSPYLTDLAAGLPDDVEVMWTGQTVCAPTITVADARARAAALGGRAPLVWDNYPVNDATMTASLHLGPYRGRDPKLAGAIDGFLLNPMIQPRASMVALATAAAYFNAPDAYDPSRAWDDAIATVGGDHAAALGTLARACADSALARPDDLDLARRVEAFAADLDSPGWPEPATDIATVLRDARALSEGMDGAGPLAEEVAPWCKAAHVEANAGLAALRLIQQIRPIGQRDDDGHVHGAAPDADLAMQHAFAMMFAWREARANQRVVFGPRFALYTPVVQLADGLPGLDAAEVLREDANAIDVLCRMALRAYGEWSEHANAPLRLSVDGVECPPAPDGRFDVGARSGAVLVHAGPYTTGVDAVLPFRDRRLGRERVLR